MYFEYLFTHSETARHDQTWLVHLERLIVSITILAMVWPFIGSVANSVFQLVIKMSSIISFLYIP